MFHPFHKCVLQLVFAQTGGVTTRNDDGVFNPAMLFPDTRHPLVFNVYVPVTQHEEVESRHFLNGPVQILEVTGLKALTGQIVVHVQEENRTVDAFNATTRLTLSAIL
jgi:hypothetical protein